MTEEILKEEEMKEEEIQAEACVPDAEENKSEDKPKKVKKDDKKTEKLKKEIEGLKAENEELNDKYLRVLAEYDNYRRRSQKEKEASYTDAYVDAIKEILPIIDNLERAATFNDNDKVSEGVAMTLNQFKVTLERMGVAEIEAAPGVEFDPNLHNAIMHCEDENLGSNVIAEVFQKGYVKGDKVIRYTMCKVAN